MTSPALERMASNVRELREVRCAGHAFNRFYHLRTRWNDEIRPWTMDWKQLETPEEVLEAIDNFSPNQSVWSVHVIDLGDQTTDDVTRDFLEMIEARSREAAE